ncbi:MAG: 16S rRNA (guanine(527)-N(7))-methyltransferase RsmG [Rhodospirillales bacterium]|nr:16S rRNA (guanine(527)-N(7))-methyltransferase RsmG [Rhodospirillales bacterium]MCB9997019.1 16S rRNA (guanine(527)-N(7))-methyltransferase RsmG [Rhodospirillales bacterium]
MLPEDSRQKLKQYLALLRKWQCSINLVSPATLDHAWERHFEDSLQLAALIPEEAVLFDLGCGAGFPGLVLAIARPDIKVTLIESDTKKCTFLSTVSRETMTPVSVVNQRIESAVTDSIPTIITARALASLDKLLGYVMPWAKANPDLVLLFLKGRQAADEVTDALRLYDFTYEMVPSRTDSEAQIVRISNLREKSDG